MNSPTIIVSNSSDDLGRTAAQVVLESAGRASSPDGMFTVALSGGNTPRALFNALAAPPFRDSMPWDRTQVFFSDERFVPPDSADSNYHTAQECLLSRVPIPDRFVHRVATVDVDPEESASIYEEGIRRVLEAGSGDVPPFDLILLGLGEDGHTASLFPNTGALDAEDALVVPNYVSHLGTWRITFTYPLINAAKRVVFLVSGREKAPVVAAVLAGSSLPASRIRPSHGELYWVLDPDAASQLSEGSEPVA